MKSARPTQVLTLTLRLKLAVGLMLPLKLMQMSTPQAPSCRALLRGTPVGAPGLRQQLAKSHEMGDRKLSACGLHALMRPKQPRSNGCIVHPCTAPALHTMAVLLLCALIAGQFAA